MASMTSVVKLICAVVLAGAARWARAAGLVEAVCRLAGKMTTLRLLLTQRRRDEMPGRCLSPPSADGRRLPARRRRPVAAVPHIPDIQPSKSGMRRIAADQRCQASTGTRPTAVAGIRAAKVSNVAHCSHPTCQLE
jgi:hypothetical protein